MSGVEREIYLVAIGDTWVSPGQLSEQLPGSMVSFGTVDADRACIRKAAAQMNKPECVFRIVKYRFAYEVLEG